MTEVETPRRATGFRLALAGACLTVTGPLLWAATVGVPFLWETGLLMWVAFTAGAALGVAALWRDRRYRTWLPAGFSIGMLVVAVLGYAVLTAMPASPAFEGTAEVPDFTLPNQNGTPVALGDLLKDNAVLLAFYRGYW